MSIRYSRKFRNECAVKHWDYYVRKYLTTAYAFGATDALAVLAHSDMIGIASVH